MAVGGFGGRLWRDAIHAVHLARPALRSSSIASKTTMAGVTDPGQPPGGIDLLGEPNHGISVLLDLREQGHPVVASEGSTTKTGL
jgi:hypothetical protein